MYAKRQMLQQPVTTTRYNNPHNAKMIECCIEM